MKKRIVVSSLITVIFALIVVTSSFIALLNVKEIERTKDILSSYNDMVIRHIKLGDDDLVGFKINNSTVRFTIVDKAGNVIKDSENNNLENHSSREEIIGAFKNGKSTSTRYSKTEGVNVIYYATKIDENTVLRSSVPISNIKFFTEGYIKYYLIIIFFVIYFFFEFDCVG